jgi:phage gpG-like protein
MQGLLQLNSFAALAASLAAEATGFYKREQQFLEVAAIEIQRTAKSMYGIYQPSVDVFGAWPELAASTKADRRSKGYTENDPLLRSGGLRDSIKYEIHGLSAVIGSEDKVAFWQEFGTSGMPPRPTLGPALARSMPRVSELLGDVLIRGGQAINFNMLAPGASMPMSPTGYERQSVLTP